MPVQFKKENIERFLKNAPMKSAEQLIREDLEAGKWLPLKVALPYLTSGDFVLLGGPEYPITGRAMFDSLTPVAKDPVFIFEADDGKFEAITYRRAVHISIRWVKGS